MIHVFLHVFVYCFQILAPNSYYTKYRCQEIDIAAKVCIFEVVVYYHYNVGDCEGVMENAILDVNAVEGVEDDLLAELTREAKE